MKKLFIALLSATLLLSVMSATAFAIVSEPAADDVGDALPDSAIAAAEAVEVEIDIANGYNEPDSGLLEIEDSCTAVTDNTVGANNLMVVRVQNYPILKHVAETYFGAPGSDAEALILDDCCGAYLAPGETDVWVFGNVLDTNASRPGVDFLVIESGADWDDTPILLAGTAMDCRYCYDKGCMMEERWDFSSEAQTAKTRLNLDYDLVDVAYNFHIDDYGVIDGRPIDPDCYQWVYQNNENRLEQSRKYPKAEYLEEQPVLQATVEQYFSGQQNLISVTADGYAAKISSPTGETVRVFNWERSASNDQPFKVIEIGKDREGNILLYAVYWTQFAAGKDCYIETWCGCEAGGTDLVNLKAHLEPGYVLRYSEYFEWRVVAGGVATDWKFGTRPNA